MTLLAYLVFGIYLLTLSYVTVYCVLQFQLLWQYLRKASRLRRQQKQRRPFPAQERLSATPALVGAAGQPVPGREAQEFPLVTIQLPLYNEKYVVERLIDRVCAFDYPRDRFEIQVLDDSTDETVDLVEKKVAHYRSLGFRIEQIRRIERQGYKAGALRDAMPLARGEFIAIFDADFLPEPDFLRRTLPYFQDARVGVVQTRWAHLNENYSLLTRLQAVQLNVHFSVEQYGRMAGHQFLQFNGTAGVWRRETIDAAGGWEADTLTEDLDLSIRAQLKGWRIEYLEGLGSPAELPAEMNSLKSQQFRWMKGGAETARKMLPRIWRAPIGFFKKFHATFHLLASTIFLFVFLMGVFSVPMLFFLGESNVLGIDGSFFAVFLIGLLSIAAIYFVGNVVAPFNEGPWWRRVLKFLVLFPLFLCLSMGLSLHNSVAIIQGYRGKRTPFVRTPKFNIRSIRDGFTKKEYIERKLSWTTLFEGVLTLYFSLAVAWALWSGELTFVVYHLMLALGFGSIFWYTLKHLSLK